MGHLRSQTKANRAALYQFPCAWLWERFNGWLPEKTKQKGNAIAWWRSWDVRPSRGLHLRLLVDPMHPQNRTCLQRKVGAVRWPFLSSQMQDNSFRAPNFRWSYA